MSTQNTKGQRLTCSLGEFAERYMFGEQFYYMDADRFYEIPENISAADLKRYYYSGVVEKAEPDWYENLGDGVLCWVCDEIGKDRLGVVTLFDDGLYYVEDHEYSYDCAKPLTKEEALRFVRGEV